jgi:predicted  nucleic acid-binding Zn-ribbon protein
MNRQRNCTTEERNLRAITIDTRNCVLGRMRVLKDLNIMNNEMYQRVDDRMSDIEKMVDDEKVKYLDEYRELEIKMKEIKRRDVEAHVEFEYLREEYIRCFM